MKAGKPLITNRASGDCYDMTLSLPIRHDVLRQISRRVGYCRQLSRATIAKQITDRLSNVQHYISRYLYRRRIGR